VSLWVTAILAGVAVLACVVCGWLGARPAQPLGPPRLVPWRLMMLIFFALAVAAIGHIVALVKGA